MITNFRVMKNVLLLVCLKRHNLKLDSQASYLVFSSQPNQVLGFLHQLI